MIFNTVEEAQANCRYWQEILRLQDWDVIIELVHHHELNGVIAAVSSNEYLKVARISLLRAEELRKEDMDMESSLVHELLHVHTKDWEILNRKYEHSDVLQEQAIESLTKAIIKLNRKTVKICVVNDALRQ